MKTVSILSLLVTVFLAKSQANVANLVLKGELMLGGPIPDPITNEDVQALETRTLDLIGNITNIDKSCLKLSPEFSPHADGNDTKAAYTLEIDLDRCQINGESFINNISLILGVSSMTFKISPTLQGEFWDEPLNSILVFAASGVVILILFITCVVVLYRAHQTDKQCNTSSLPTSKKRAGRMPYEGYERENSHEPYAMDTMVMDMPRSKSNSNNNVSTIERWVSSQLKAKAPKHLPGANDSPAQYVLTTDSGIVTTSPRRPHKIKEHPDADTMDSNEPRLAGYKKIDGSISLDLIPPSCRAAPRAVENLSYSNEPESSASLPEETTSLDDSTAEDQQH